MGNNKSNKNSKRAKARFFNSKWLLFCLLFLLLLGVIAWLVFVIVTAKYRDRADEYDLSKIDDVEVRSLILDRKGREIGRIFVENRDKVSIDAIPENMINALVSGEDQRFFTHDGVDRVGVLRAIVLNIQAGRQTQGASTLTQQLARNAFNLKAEADKRDEGGLARKAVEAYLAMRISDEYSKREVLEFYLNRVPFGSGFYGVKSASLGYFGKEPIDLTVSECASLVGCIKNPTRISPLNSLEENKKARNQVLKRLVAEGLLPEDEGLSLMEDPVVIDPKPIRRGTSHLYERVAGAVRKHLGDGALTEGGFTIHTTIDMDIQQEMEQSLLRNLAAVESREGYEHVKYESYRKEDGRPKYLQGVGMMVDNSSGSIIAYVGGRDFTHSQYDFVKSGSKPLGTAFLPFVYATAIEKGKSTVSRLVDEPMDNRSVMVDGREGILGEWGMETLTPDYEGDITLRRAFEASKIAASVRLGSNLGVDEVASTATRLGMKMPEGKLLRRLLVGTGDASIPNLVRAYTTFPNEGHMVKSTYFIDKIVDVNGEERYKAKKNERTKRVMAKENSYLVHTLLKGSLINGSGVDEGAASFLGNGVAGKSGTTYDFANNWFVGYNGSVTCGMWMGFLDGSRKPIYPGAFSKETILPSWMEVMKSTDKILPAKAIPVPDKIEILNVCKDSGLNETRYCKDYKRNEVTGAEAYRSTTYREAFIKGRGPSGSCDFHGVSYDKLADNQGFGSPDQLLTTSHASPIRPKNVVLLGKDPYGSEKIKFAPKAGGVKGARDTIILEALDDADAGIKMGDPSRIKIYEENK